SPGGGRWRGEPVLDRPRRGGGHVDRHAVYAVRAAGGLCNARDRPSRQALLRPDPADRRIRSGPPAQDHLTALTLLRAAASVAARGRTCDILSSLAPTRGPGT